MKTQNNLLALLFCLAAMASYTCVAAERDAEAAMKAALGESPDLAQPERPAKLPDFTKGEPMPPPRKDPHPIWNMGPTGIIGMHNQQNKGDQIRVISIRPGSPAEGKVLPGDVLIGVAGKNFAPGGHMGMDAGYAIMAAEEEAAKGILNIRIWRDRNWLKREGAKDMFAEDIESVFKEAEDSADVYEWKGEEERTTAVKQMAFDKHPIDGVEMDVTLQLRVMGTYSDSSPWDCPVVEKAREDAWKVIAKKFEINKKRRRVLAGWPDVLALVASGKPEYVALAKKWVHSQKLETDMERVCTLEDVTYRGMQSWHAGFNYLEMAIYYNATGDKYVLPEVRKRAIVTALGQNGGGSWGHTFAFREFNGGFLHRNNPGYGAMNNAGGRCFFLLALASEAGIKHPEIDAALWRASRFFNTFVDKGCIPYGYHSPAGSDDSNGKNYGPAYAFYTLGQKYEAKFFSMHSANASFTRRGGHGSPTLWYYTPLAANIAGPKAVKSSMRNMRWFYTLSRNHDGSFVFLGDQSPGIGGRGMRNPTATVALHLSGPLQQLMITGKDADEKFWMTDEELAELLHSAHGQIKEPVLREQIGKPITERGTDELIDTLDHFFPKMRVGLAAELGKRYEAGEKDIVTKLLVRMSSDEARMRSGACEALSACGKDAVLAHLSKIIPLLNDKAEFVRMAAVNTVAKATVPGDKKREEILLQAAADDYAGMTADNGNVRNAVKGVLFAHYRDKSVFKGAAKLGTEPFQAGYDETLVRNAFERIVTMDPQGTVPKAWNKEALLKLAGPITFSADELQVNDAMFGGARKSQAQALLTKHGYREAIEGRAANLMKRSLLERSRRRGVQYKDSFIVPTDVKLAPGRYRFILDDLRLWQQDNPIVTMSEKTGKDRPPITTPLNLLIEFIEKDKKSQLPPSIATDVAKMFESELKRAGNNSAQMKLCREELKNLDRPNFFRKMAAMTTLSERLGPDAIDDVSPFLGHPQWRLRKHADTVTRNLIKQGAGPRLLELFEKAQAEKSGLSGNLNAAGILETLANAKHKPALATVKAALKHHDHVVRGAAVKAAFTIGGNAELQTVFSFLETASEFEDFHGAEQALLSKRDDTAHVEKVNAEALKKLPTSALPQRRSYAWLLGQFGGPTNLAAIQKAAATTTDDGDLKEMVTALAYSPDRAADQTMLALTKINKRVRDAVIAQSVHRMVGRNGAGDVTDADRVKFARAILNQKYDNRLITYLGRVYTGPSIRLMFDVMKKGGKSTTVAVEAIIACAEGMHKPSAADAKIAAEVLTEVIEYIEVTRLRGGAKAHSDKHDNYHEWKGLQGRAGQSLLRVHKPKKAAIPQFDDSDLDL